MISKQAVSLSMFSHSYVNLLNFDENNKILKCTIIFCKTKLHKAAGQFYLWTASYRRQYTLDWKAMKWMHQSALGDCKSSNSMQYDHI